MPNKSQHEPSKPGTSEQEALDALNAEMRAKRNTSEAIRHTMEEQIEQTAKNRRGAALAAKRRK